MPNFSFLKNDLVNTTENDSTEFENQISFFVEKTENRLTNDLDDFGLDFLRLSLVVLAILLYLFLLIQRLLEM